MGWKFVAVRNLHEAQRGRPDHRWENIQHSLGEYLQIYMESPEFAIWIGPARQSGCLRYFLPELQPGRELHLREHHPQEHHLSRPKVLQQLGST